MNWNQVDWLGFSWSQWIPLESSIQVYQTQITKSPGLYRIRLTHNNKLAYIGQTGRDLRDRTRQLASKVNNSQDNPPWNDPHTAAPALWAWKIENGYRYEVSVFAIDLETRERQCLEDMLLYQYRLEAKESTLANHGRFHPKWTRPSNKKSNNRMKKIVVGNNPSWGESLPPVEEVGKPIDSNWLNLDWSDIKLLNKDIQFVPNEPGVYRLLNAENVVYMGETQKQKLKSRLVSHAKKYGQLNLKFSYCEMKEAKIYQLKERETDLIGAFYKHERQVPLYQYGS